MNPTDTNIIHDALKICRKAFYWLLLTSLVTNLLMLVPTLYILQLFSRVLPSQRYETLLYLTFIAISATVALSLLVWIRGRVLATVGQWLGQHLSLPALSRCPEQLLRGVRYGTQSLSDVNQIAGFISSPAMLALLDIPWVFIYLFVIFMLHFSLGVITLVGALLLSFFAVLNQWLTHTPYQRVQTKLVKNQLLIDASLRNAETIQAMGMMPNLLKNWKERNDEALQELRPTQAIGANIQAVVHFIRLALQILIMGYGAYLVLHQELTAGGMIAASVLLSRALSPLENGINSWQLVDKTLIAYRRLMIHLQTPSPAMASYLPQKPTGLIEVQELYFQTPGLDKKLILENLSFRIEPGEIVAIIGSSGAGKTTLARMIMGVYEPTRGVCRMDGVNTYKWERADFGKHAGYLPQDIELFDGSVSLNISRMDEAPKESIAEAAQLANVHELILRLSKGYETEIGPNGAALSGGLRQRVALARALWGHPSLLVLDEPNSNLDDEGIAALVEALKEIKQKRETTVVLITHLKSLLQVADKLMLMAQGRMIAYGPTAEVLQKLQPPRPNPPPMENTSYAKF